MSERAENATKEERFLFNKACTPGEVRNPFINLCDQQHPHIAANAFSLFLISVMASTKALLAAATFTLFSSALAFSPDQCNITAYGAPTAAACTTLLASIAKLGVGNTSYLFIPSQFPTPAGVNGTRKEFPQSWSTSTLSRVSPVMI